MDKKKTSKRPRKSSTAKPPVTEVSEKAFERISRLAKHSAGRSFANKDLVAKALGEAILSGDADTVKEILEGFVRAQNVSKIAGEHGFSRIRVYQALEKTGNPTLETICKIASAFVKAS
jgi:probable addiction module antidote protein